MLGEDIYTDNTILCGNLTFWRKQPCGEKMIRCQGARAVVNSGQCVYKEYWGTEGAKDKNVCTYNFDTNHEEFKSLIFLVLLLGIEKQNLVPVNVNVSLMKGTNFVNGLQ